MKYPLLHVAAVALASLPITAQAQDAAIPAEDVTAFEACFIQMMIDNPDNPMLELIGPISCGERTISMGQTCDGLDYMLFDRRAVCKTGDLAFWQEQVAAQAEAALADGRGGLGLTHTSGLERCAELDAEGEDSTQCLIELNWRSSMEFIAAALVADLATQSE